MKQFLSQLFVPETESERQPRHLSQVVLPLSERVLTHQSGKRQKVVFVRRDTANSFGYQSFRLTDLLCDCIIKSKFDLKFVQVQAISLLLGENGSKIDQKAFPV
ncbi:MAG: hypothetical protein GXO70_00305 [Acidobacteria bacterium]|nr:hypothetical protein [Acidobacteriota bacterium]